MINDLTVNGVSFNWKDIEVHFIGVLGQNVNEPPYIYSPMDVSSVNYNTVYNTELNYSRTGFPVSHSFGKYECNANITLAYSELVYLRSSMIGYNIGVQPIDIKIVYKIGEIEIIDSLYGCRPSFPDTLGGNQGDMNLKATINLNPVWIKYDKNRINENINGFIDLNRRISQTL